MHISKVNPELRVGLKVAEGQVLGETGNSGRYRDKKTGGYKNYNPHLHVDAVDKKGNSIDPENRNYGQFTEQEFFGDAKGDYKNLQYYGGELEELTVTAEKPNTGEQPSDNESNTEQVTVDEK